MNKFIDIVNSRGNTTKFDPSFNINQKDIEEIINIAGKTPSGWNLQPWRFIVCDSKKSRDILLPIAYNQSQITDASAVIIVMADTKANEKFNDIYEPLVENGHMEERIKDILETQVIKAYNYEENVLEHSYTNTALSIMSLVYAAESFGYDTGIIGGFDKKRLKDDFQLLDRFMPMVIIPIGKKTAEPHYSERLDSKLLTTWL